MAQEQGAPGTVGAILWITAQCRNDRESTGNFTNSQASKDFRNSERRWQPARSFFLMGGDDSRNFRTNANLATKMEALLAPSLGSAEKPPLLNQRWRRRRLNR